jgi:hypothetical protein
MKAASHVLLRYTPSPDTEEVVSARMQDCDEGGCGLRVDVEIAPGTEVTVNGDLMNTGQASSRHGHVAWCRQSAVKGNLLGIVFSGKAGEFRAERRKTKQGYERVIPVVEEQPDYYEVLQISPNADDETLQRVYRALAQRYHPDNQQTGNGAMFRRVLDAYQVLSDPERRARYDVDYRLLKKLQWRVFDQPSATGGVESERAKRRGILAVLYTKRRNLPQQAGMTLFELEEILGIPRDHLEFALWFLREAGLITRSDNQKYAITVRGAEHAEETGACSAPGDRLIESPEAIARRSSLG